MLDCRGKYTHKRERAPDGEMVEYYIQENGAHKLKYEPHKPEKQLSILQKTTSTMLELVAGPKKRAIGHWVISDYDSNDIKSGAEKYRKEGHADDVLLDHHWQKLEEISGEIHCKDSESFTIELAVSEEKGCLQNLGLSSKKVAPAEAGYSPILSGDKDKEQPKPKPRKKGSFLHEYYEDTWSNIRIKEKKDNGEMEFMPLAKKDWLIKCFGQLGTYGKLLDEEVPDKPACKFQGGILYKYLFETCSPLEPEVVHVAVVSEDLLVPVKDSWANYFHKGSAAPIMHGLLNCVIHNEPKPNEPNTLRVKKNGGRWSKAKMDEVEIQYTGWKETLSKEAKLRSAGRCFDRNWKPIRLKYTDRDIEKADIEIADDEKVPSQDQFPLIIQGHPKKQMIVLLQFELMEFNLTQQDFVDKLKTSLGQAAEEFTSSLLKGNGEITSGGVKPAATVKLQASDEGCSVLVAVGLINADGSSKFASEIFFQDLKDRMKKEAPSILIGGGVTEAKDDRKAEMADELMKLVAVKGFKAKVTQINLDFYQGYLHGRPPLREERAKMIRRRYLNPDKTDEYDPDVIAEDHSDDEMIGPIIPPPTEAENVTGYTGFFFSYKKGGNSDEVVDRFELRQVGTIVTLYRNGNKGTVAAPVKDLVFSETARAMESYEIKGFGLMNQKDGTQEGTAQCELMEPIGSSIEWANHLISVKEGEPEKPDVPVKGCVLEILQAEQLRRADFVPCWSSDPYVQVHCNGKFLYKTQVKKRTLAPNWDNAKVIINNWNPSMAIDFTVMDRDDMLERMTFKFLKKNDDTLGEAKLSTDKLDVKKVEKPDKFQEEASFGLTGSAKLDVIFQGKTHGYLEVKLKGLVDNNAEGNDAGCGPPVDVEASAPAAASLVAMQAEM
jgi:hypothetical protein